MICPNLIVTFILPHKIRFDFYFTVQHPNRYIEVRQNKSYFGCLGCAFLEEQEEFPGIPFFGGLKKKECRSFLKGTLDEAGQTAKEPSKTCSFFGGM